MAAAADPSTAFGAELAGWAYPASMVDLLGLAAAIGNKKATEKVMPWVMKKATGREQAAADEVAKAAAELEDGIVFG